MMYYAELADHDGPSNTARTNNNRNRRSSAGVTTSTISLELDDLVGSSNESLDSLCGSFGGNKMMMNGGSYFNKGIRRVSTSRNSSHNNSSFFDLGDDFDFNETDDDDDEDDDAENDNIHNNEDKVDDINNMKKLHDQIQRLDDSKLSKKALSFANHKRMSMSENWAYDHHQNSGSLRERTRKVQFSNNEPEIIFIDKAQPEDYDCLYYDEMELQRMFDEFRIEEREARRHSLR